MGRPVLIDDGLIDDRLIHDGLIDDRLLDDRLRDARPSDRGCSQAAVGSPDIPDKFTAVMLRWTHPSVHSGPR